MILRHGHHAVAAALACLVLGGALASATAYARTVQARHIHTLAPTMSALKNQGSELQLEAFRHPDLLVVYGSSEMEQANPYHASELFKTYPTGFTVFPVGRGATTSLVILQDLAAIGPELRGKKVAISVSPPWFFLHDRTPEFYAPNYSALHLNALIFSTDLSLETKQAVVRQLVQSPSLFSADPLAAFAAERLLDDGLLSRAGYLASLPLGKLHTALLAMQDCFTTYAFIQAQPAEPAVTRGTTGIDWSSMLQAAESEQLAAATNNDFGFDNTLWIQKYRKLVAERRAQFNDAWFIDNVKSSAEWTDLDLLLRGLSELGAEPLLLSQPIPGKYYDYIGISAAARSHYYTRLRGLAASHDVAVVDFADHDGDVNFVADPNSHLSRKGWTYYDRALDAFYHGTLGELARTEWSAGVVLPGDSARTVAAIR